MNKTEEILTLNFKWLGYEFMIVPNSSVGPVNISIRCYYLFFLMLKKKLLQNQAGEHTRSKICQFMYRT